MRKSKNLLNYKRKLTCLPGMPLVRMWVFNNELARMRSSFVALRIGTYPFGHRFFLVPNTKWVDEFFTSFSQNGNWKLGLFYHIAKKKKRNMELIYSKKKKCGFQLNHNGGCASTFNIWLLRKWFSKAGCLLMSMQLTMYPDFIYQNKIQQK